MSNAAGEKRPSKIQKIDGPMSSKAAEERPSKRQKIGTTSQPVAATNAANATALPNKSVVLGIPENLPIRPQLPSESGICRGNAPEVASYVNNLSLIHI